MVIREVGDGESDAPTEEEEDRGHPAVEFAGGPQAFQRVVIGFDPSGLGGFPGGGAFPGVGVFPGALGGHHLGGHLGEQLDMDAQGWSGEGEAQAAAAERESLQAEIERLQEVLDIVMAEVDSLEEAPPIHNKEDPEFPRLREHAASLRDELTAVEEEGKQLRAVADDLDREMALMDRGPPNREENALEEHALVAEELTRRTSEHEGLTAQGEQLEKLLEELRSRRAERERHAHELLARYHEVQEQGTMPVSQPNLEVIAGQGDDEELEAAELQAELARLNAESTQLKADCHDLKQTAQRISEEHEENHLDPGESPEVQAELARAHGELEALRAANARLRVQCVHPATASRDVMELPSVSRVPVPGRTMVPSSAGRLPQPVERRVTPQFTTVPLPSKLRARVPEATAVLSAAPPSYQTPAMRPLLQSTSPLMPVLTSPRGAGTAPQQVLQAAPAASRQVESRDFLMRSAPAASYTKQSGQATPPHYAAPHGHTNGGNLSTTVPMVHIMGRSHT